MKGNKKRVRSVILVLDFCPFPPSGSTWFSKLTALISSLQIHRGGRTHIMDLNEVFFGAKMLRPASPSRETKGEGLLEGAKPKKTFHRWARMFSIHFSVPAAVFV